MIDNFAIGLTHLLMALAAWRLLSRSDLDQESAVPGKPANSESSGDSVTRKSGARHV